jgi:hypothetical protein
VRATLKAKDGIMSEEQFEELKEKSKGIVVV